MEFKIIKKAGSRIVVVGTSCSGKTTFAGNIAGILDIPHFELDVLHWGPNWTSREDFVDNVMLAIQNPQWVIDGNYRKVRDIIWEKVDVIIWLNYSFPIVFWRALKRTLYRIFSQKELYAGNREKFLTSFFSSDSMLWWVIKTYKRRKKEYGQLSNRNNLSHLEIIQLNNPKEAELFLQNLQLELNKK